MKIKSIVKHYEGEYKTLNSKFLSFLYPFSDKQQLQVYLDKLWKEHPKSRHICYAYRLGFSMEETRANDDGEPSGTAGKPILNQLYSFELQNAVLFVVRYFGGTKLGVPGLIDAYKKSAIDALSKAEFQEIEETTSIQMNIPQLQYYSLLKQIKAHQIQILHEEFSVDGYQIKLEIPLSKLDLFGDYLK